MLIQEAGFDINTNQTEFYKAVQGRLNRGKPVPHVRDILFLNDLPNPIQDKKPQRFIFIAELDPCHVPFSMQEILNSTAEAFSVRAFDIKSQRRSKYLCLARFATYYLLREKTFHSLVEIGLFVGGRDHTTVIGGIRRCEALMAVDRDFSRRIEGIEVNLARMNS